jgi:hypothetical protein
MNLDNIIQNISVDDILYNIALDTIIRLADMELYTKMYAMRSPYRYYPDVHRETDEPWRKMYTTMIQNNTHLLSNPVKVLIAYVALTKDRRDPFYAIYEDRNGVLFLRKGYPTIGPVFNATIICTPLDLVKLIDGRIPIEADLPTVLVENQWIPNITIGAAQELVDELMEPSTSFIRTLYDWVGNFTNHEPYYYIYISTEGMEGC